MTTVYNPLVDLPDYIPLTQLETVTLSSGQVATVDVTSGSEVITNNNEDRSTENAPAGYRVPISGFNKPPAAPPQTKQTLLPNPLSDYESYT